MKCPAQGTPGADDQERARYFLQSGVLFGGVSMIRIDYSILEAIPKKTTDWVAVQELGSNQPEYGWEYCKR